MCCLSSETEIYIARPHQEPGEIGEVHVQPAPEHPAGARRLPPQEEEGSLVVKRHAQDNLEVETLK